MIIKKVYNLNTHIRIEAYNRLHDISRNGYGSPFFLTDNGKLTYDSVYGYSYMPYFTDDNIEAEAKLNQQFRLYFGCE